MTLTGRVPLLVLLGLVPVVLRPTIRHRLAVGAGGRDPGRPARLVVRATPGPAGAGAPPGRVGPSRGADPDPAAGRQPVAPPGAGRRPRRLAADRRCRGQPAPARTRSRRAHHLPHHADVPRRRGDLRGDRGDRPPPRPPRARRPPAHRRGRGVGTVTAGLRRPQAPAQPAVPAPGARRPRRGPGAGTGHRVRLAAGVRARRRRPVDRLAGQRPQPARRGADLAARAGPAGGARPRHLADLRRPGHDRGPRTCRAWTRRWMPRCCWLPWPRAPATGSTSWPATAGSAAGCARPARETSSPPCRR